MKLRVARHTASLEKMVYFYHRLLGLELLGNFKGHDNYDGVFFGFRNADWHLEFTFSEALPVHHSDEDDLLVFYLDTPEIQKQLVERFTNNGFSEVLPKNPYWIKNGNAFRDPDGFLIVLTVK
jgi:catechol 2,3-dioxygenase-like lactoylglutathione lyase family enzyme